jgi:predicted amidophosphoribosyltransferase
MELTTILLIIAVLVIVLLIAARSRPTAHQATPVEVKKELPAIQTISQKRYCPSCQKEISSSAHKCPECQSYVSVCPTCDKDSVFSSLSKDGLKRLKVQSGFSTLGWPLSKIAVCESCKTPFLLCSYCGTPAPTASNNCPNCDAMLAVGLVPILKDLGEVIGGIVQGRVKTPGKKVTRK